MPDTRTRDIYRPCQMHKHTGTVDTVLRIVGIPVIRIHRRREETRVVRVRALDRQIRAIQGEDFLFPHTRPIRYIMVHKRRMEDEDLMRLFRSRLPNRGKLDIIIRLTTVTPEYGVEDHTAVTHIDTTGTSMTTTIIGDIRTGTVVCRHGTVVNRTTLGEVDTAAFGVRGVIIDHTGCSIGRIEIRNGILRQDRVRYTHIPWILVGYMADHQTSTATRCTRGNMAMTDRALMVDTDTTTIALYHTYTHRLTGMYVAKLNLTTAVGVNTTTSQGSVASLNDTVPQRGVTHHIDTTTVRRMLTHQRITRRGVTAGDDTSVQRGGVDQRLIVILQGIVRYRVFTVRSKPYYVIRAGRISGVISSSDRVELIGDDSRGVVSGQDRLMLQIPLRGDLRSRDDTYTLGIRPVILAFLAVHHHTVTRCRLVHTRISRIGVKATIEMNTAVDLKRGIKHRTTAVLGGLRRDIGTGSYIHRTRSEVVLLHVFTQIIDRILNTVFRRSPRATIVVIRSCGTIDITNRIRLRRYYR